MGAGGSAPARCASARRSWSSRATRWATSAAVSRPAPSSPTGLPARNRIAGNSCARTVSASLFKGGHFRGPYDRWTHSAASEVKFKAGKSCPRAGLAPGGARSSWDGQRAGRSVSLLQACEVNGYCTAQNIET